MIMLQQMSILFIIMIVGLIARKYEIITESSSKKLSALIVNVSNPCFILSSVVEGNSIKGDELIRTAILAVIVYVVLITIAFFLPVLIRVPKNNWGAYKAMTVFTNLGFMGFPIVAGLYGNEAVLYAAIFTFPFNILIYTYGIYVMKGENKSDEAVTENDNTESGKKFDFKLLINPGVVAAITAIIIYVSGLCVPYIIAKSVTMIGATTAPLSMMVIGASFIDIDIRSIFTDIKLLIFSFIKLFLIPLIGGFIIRIFISNDILYGVSIIMIATPVASMVAMFANEYDCAVEETTKGVALTTLLSVITLPLVSVIMGI